MSCLLDTVSFKATDSDHFLSFQRQQTRWSSCLSPLTLPHGAAPAPGQAQASPRPRHTPCATGYRKQEFRGSPRP